MAITGSITMDGIKRLKDKLDTDPNGLAKIVIDRIALVDGNIPDGATDYTSLGSYTGNNPFNKDDVKLMINGNVITGDDETDLNDKSVQQMLFIKDHITVAEFRLIIPADLSKVANNYASYPGGSTKDFEIKEIGLFDKDNTKASGSGAPEEGNKYYSPMMVIKLDNPIKKTETNLVDITFIIRFNLAFQIITQSQRDDGEELSKLNDITIKSTTELLADFSTFSRKTESNINKKVRVFGATDLGDSGSPKLYISNKKESEGSNKIVESDDPDDFVPITDYYTDMKNLTLRGTGDYKAGDIIAHRQSFTLSAGAKITPTSTTKELINLSSLPSGLSLGTVKNEMNNKDKSLSNGNIIITTPIGMIDVYEDRLITLGGIFTDTNYRGSEIYPNTFSSGKYIYINKHPTKNDFTLSDTNTYGFSPFAVALSHRSLQLISPEDPLIKTKIENWVTPQISKVVNDEVPKLLQKPESQGSIGAIVESKFTELLASKESVQVYNDTYNIPVDFGFYGNSGRTGFIGSGIIGIESILILDRDSGLAFNKIKPVGVPNGITFYAHDAYIPFQVNFSTVLWSKYNGGDATSIWFTSTPPNKRKVVPSDDGNQPMSDAFLAMGYGSGYYLKHASAGNGNATTSSGIAFGFTDKKGLIYPKNS